MNNNNHHTTKQFSHKTAYLVGGLAMALLTACASSTPVGQKTSPHTPKIIQKNQQVRQDNASSPKQIYVIYGDEHGHSHDIPRNVGTKADFDAWLLANPHQASQVSAYENYLAGYLGKNKIPPMYELLTTARAWQECGYEPYEVPPRELWSAMLPTIRLFNELQGAGILPSNTHIRSVYRSPDLNRCAGGAPSSKHMSNGAMDIWVPNYQVGSWELTQLQNRLCEYWLSNGKSREFGLGLYATGAIHLDTQGYRKWGAQFSESQSICRITPPKSSE